jgi:hypothetical protein
MDSLDSGDNCLHSNFVNGVLFQLQSPFDLKIYPLKPPGGQDFGETLNHNQDMHTSTYMQIPTYRYIPIHADTCTYISYQQIQMDSYSNKHIHTHTGVCRCQHRYTHIQAIQAHTSIFELIYTLCTYIHM